jgi:hypothetical protein
MQKEKEKLEHFKNKTAPGWSSLLDIVNNILDIFPESVSIKSIDKKHGMLSIQFNLLSDPHLTYLLNSLSYKIERDSARICKVCGSRGMRRKLLNNDVYCFSCWLDVSNNNISQEST